MGNRAVCSLCKFSVPWDRIGMELIQQHLRDRHGITPPYPGAKS